jgi:diguanylate cyclase (GGDEF)-like protein
LHSIKSSNALTLLCLGILVGLGIYYLSLSAARHRRTESMYALFILGNLLFNGTAGLVFADILNWHWFYLATVPILFSNMAYILFVKSLLDIRHTTYPRLHKLGQGALVVLVGFALFSLAAPNWSMEMCRYGVGIFLVYGLLCGSYISFQGNTSARFYLIAILAFFALGFVSISLSDVTGQYTLHVEHLGLLSVTIEVILLALVLTYQFHQLHHEKEHALSRLETSQILAMTDSLTGLPNRYSLEKAIEALPAEGSLTFLDLDGLKYYNDHFGHDRGDTLLRDLSTALQAKLGSKATLHRLGGDEFAVTCPTGNQSFVESMLAETVVHLRANGFEFAGFSVGTVHVYETAGNHNKLMHIADTRMYENKRQRKKNPASAANLAGTPD